MTLDALLLRLFERGIVLSNDGGRLRYRGPKGALTEDDLAALRQFKPEIAALPACQDCGRWPLMTTPSRRAGVCLACQSAHQFAKSIAALREQHAGPHQERFSA